MIEQDFGKVAFKAVDFILLIKETTAKSFGLHFTKGMPDIV